MPASAAWPARLVAALPVEAVAIVVAPCCIACTTPTELARSLSDAVGLRLSSFTSSCPTPISRASRGEIEDRRPAHGPALRNRSRIERQQLAVAPVVERPARERLGPPRRPHAIEVEANLENAFIRPARGASHLAPRRPIRLLATNTNQLTDARRHDAFSDYSLYPLPGTATSNHAIGDAAGWQA